MTRAPLRALAVLALLGARPAASEEAAPPAAPEGPACAEARAASFALDGVLVREAVPLFRPYLSDASGRWADHAKRLEDWLRKRSGGETDLLRDVGTLAKVLHRARSFDAPFTRGAFARGVEMERDEVRRITSYSGHLLPKESEAVGQKVRMSLVLPTTYPSEARRLVEVPPFPTLLVLHDREDLMTGGKAAAHPGAGALRRRWLDDPARRAGLAPDWILAAPVAAEADFAGDLRERVVGPLEVLWNRFSVDFDRIVVDGGADAFAAAASRPNLFAGLVLRGGTVDPSLVRNLARMPVYVVGPRDSPAAASLRGAGLEPTVGGPEGALAWLASVCRTPRSTPRDFAWRVGHPVQHRLAHWIALHEPEPGAEMTVRVDPAANRVRVDVRGAEALHVFLNDRVVDLRRPVEVVVNGTVVLPAALLEPRLSTAFKPTRDPWVLDNRSYGWLYPVFLEALRAPPPPAPAKGEGPAAPK